MKKTLTILASLFVLGAGAAQAQTSSGSPNNSMSGGVSSKNEVVAHDVTGFSNPYTGPSTVNNSKRSAAPNMHPDLKPRPSGIITDTVKYGAILYSPTAPAEYGLGEKYLSAPDPRYDVEHMNGPAAHRTAGGLKLFSFEF
jgi:hypothetical protein